MLVSGLRQLMIFLQWVNAEGALGELTESTLGHGFLVYDIAIVSVL